MGSNRRRKQQKNDAKNCAQNHGTICGYQRHRNEDKSCPDHTGLGSCMQPRVEIRQSDYANRGQ